MDLDSNPVADGIHMNSRSRWFLIAILAIRGSAWANPPPTTQPEISAPLIPAMPDKIYRVFKAALEHDKAADPESIQKNLAALDGLRTFLCLNLQNLKLIRIHSLSNDRDAGLAWSLSTTGRDLIVVTPNLIAGRIDRWKVGIVEQADLKTVIDTLLVYLNGGGNNAWQPAQFSFISGVRPDGLPIYWGGVDSFHLAYAAAWRGMDQQAAALINSELKSRRTALIESLNLRVWPAVDKGMQLLESGAARGDVLTAWTVALNTSRGSQYEPQLQELLIQLRQQVMDDKALAQSPKTDPQKLPTKQQVQYYAARLADVHGMQFSNPGQCVVLRFGPGTAISDALVKIGRPSLPALIDLLDDRRLTRSLGYHRMWDMQPWVLRYQDVAVTCIEAITNLRFYDSTCTGRYLSNEEPDYRQSVIADIRLWWKQHGSESALNWQISRLNSGDIFHRIDTLHKIEKLDPRSVNAIALLKLWAIKARGTERAVRDLSEIACELALRGDFSMRGEIRNIAPQVSDTTDSGVFIYFVRYGEPQDFAYLTNLAQKVAAEGPQGLDSWEVYMIGEELKQSNRPLAVPLLVFYLDQRELNGMRGTPNGGVQFSIADECMENLIHLTGHDEGYDRDASVEKRFATINKWQAWWHREGKAAYEAKHPELNNPNTGPTAASHPCNSLNIQQSLS
jgi:hypothetical protein